MATFSDEVTRAARELGLHVEKLSDADARMFRSSIEQAYSQNARCWPLWEAVRFPSAVQNERAWSWIGEFVGERESILFFNPADEPSMFRIASGTVLDVLLAETFGFEFYVADEQASFLLCFTHHDMLLAAGAASHWLEQRASSIETSPTEKR
jgi:hypothetical protein